MRNQNNNRKPYNNGRRNNQNYKPRKNIIKVPLHVEDSVSDDIYDEITAILTAAQFGKLSYPLSAPRALFDESVTDESKLMTIGYIQSYDAETCSFQVVIFNNIFESINSNEDFAVTPVFITRKDGSFGTITKLNMIPVVYATAESEGEAITEEVVETESDTLVTENDQDTEEIVETERTSEVTE